MENNMIKLVLKIMIVSLLLNSILFSQPKSFSEIDFIKELSKIEFYNLNKPQQSIIDSYLNDTLSSAIYGIELNPNLYMNNTGTWDTLQNGDKLWRLKIVSQGAKTLNMVFNDCILPNGVQLWVYTNNKSTIYGPITTKNNKKHGKYSTYLLYDSIAIVEVFVPNDVNFNLLKISKIIYGFRVFDNITKESEEKFLNINTYEYCRVRVNCPESEDYCKEKYSICKNIYYNSSQNQAWGRGTSSIINNTEYDFKPYLLTAFHCLDVDGNGMLNQFEKDLLSEWVFEFGYMYSLCNSGFLPTQIYAGAELKAAWLDTDFALLELEDQPQSGEVNIPDVYFNGWDRRNIIPNNTVCLSHPEGEQMEISIDNESPVASGRYPRNTTNCIQEEQDIYFWKTNWDIGSTRKGSSGAPLYNQDKLIIGQLLGGCFSCGTGHGPEYFGRIYNSWEGGGTPETRLKDWLDPNNTGAEVLDGAKLPNFWWGKEVVYNEYVHRKAITNLTIGSSATKPFQTNAGSVTNLQAGKEIVMKPCTKILAGSTFRAYIEETVCTDIITTSDKLIDYGGDICYEILSRISVVDEVEQTLLKNDVKLIIKPNPLFDNAKIEIRITPNSIINLALYDLLGNKIIEFANNEVANTSQKEYILNSTNIPSGIYTIILQSDNDVISERIAIIK